jgi:hypothetical protein
VSAWLAQCSRSQSVDDAMADLSFVFKRLESLAALHGVQKADSFGLMGPHII